MKVQRHYKVGNLDEERETNLTMSASEKEIGPYAFDSGCSANERDQHLELFPAREKPKMTTACRTPFYRNVKRTNPPKDGRRLIVAPGLKHVYYL